MAEIIRIPGPGEVIDGQFTLQREIGRGGYGVVYEAIQRGVERKVALKMLLPKALDEQSGVVERFGREARLASSMTHPSAVTIYAFGVYQAEQEEAVGLPYIAMEYLQGESLQDYLVRRGPLSPEETQGIIQEVLGSLAEAHRKGIIHRDIKPDNIFLHRPEGEPQLIKVLDFGISLAISPDWGDEDTQRLTETGLVTGTAEYMAPEQVMGNPRFTAAVDIYAIGCVCYHLLTGRFPYQGQTPVEIAIRHVYDPIPPLPEDVQHTLFGQIIERSLHKDPRVRFADAGAMLDALVSGELPPLPLDAETLVNAPHHPGTGAIPAPGAPPISGPLPPPSSQVVIPAPATPSAPHTPPPTAAPTPQNNGASYKGALIGAGVASLLIIALVSLFMWQTSTSQPGSGDPAALNNVGEASPPASTKDAPEQEALVDQARPAQTAPPSSPDATPSKDDGQPDSAVLRDAAPPPEGEVADEDQGEQADAQAATGESAEQGTRAKAAATRQARRVKATKRTTQGADDAKEVRPAKADETKTDDPTEETPKPPTGEDNTTATKAPAATPPEGADDAQGERAGATEAARPEAKDDQAKPAPSETTKADKTPPEETTKEAPPASKQTPPEKKDPPVFDGF